jgi:ABC-2 type transport system permease protein
LQINKAEWQAVATAGGFAAYYIIWTLVRNMNIVFTPFGWEWRIGANSRWS